MTDHSPIAIVEFQELRATIRQRGTAKIVVAVLAFVAWAAILFGTLATALPPIACLAPLLVLAAGFEGVRILHVGVERIGRYVQVYYETGTSAPPAWEHVAMTPRSKQGLGVPPLFAALFIPAVIANVAPVALSGVPVEFAIYGLAHVGVIVHIIRAHREAGTQRAADLAWLAQVRQSSGHIDPR